MGAIIRIQCRQNLHASLCSRRRLRFWNILFRQFHKPNKVILVTQIALGTLVIGPATC